MLANGTSPRPHAAIGCGFGGLEAVRGLSRAGVDIMLVDRANHHLFQPRLWYQVASQPQAGSWAIKFTY